MSKKKTDLSSAIDALDKALSELDAKAPEYKSQHDAAIIAFLGANASLQKGDNIILVMPLTKEPVRLTVTGVGVYTNNLTKKLDIAYSFHDQSMLYHSALEEDGYDWDYDTSKLAEAV